MNPTPIWGPIAETHAKLGWPGMRVSQTHANLGWGMRGRAPKTLPLISTDNTDLIGTSGIGNPKTLPRMNADGRGSEWGSPGDESCKSIFFGVERGWGGAGDRTLGIGKPR